MKKLIIIAAIGKNNELGKNNDLIWHIKGDMKFFKENTINHHVVMGKNTFLSLPGMLKDRVHLVLNDDDYKFPDDVIVIRSIEEFYEKA
ncbi:MAG: dihydrofolate reductase [Bacilli bacterium]|nr:dihydrofolate reductase [Bacilli bacterium]